MRLFVYLRNKQLIFSERELQKNVLFKLKIGTFHFRDYTYGVQNQKNKFFEFTTELEFQKIDIEFVKGLGDYISDNEKVIINDKRNNEFKKLLRNSETDYFSSLKISDYKIVVYLYLKDNKRKKLRLAYDDEDGFIFDFDGIHFRNNELALYIVDLLKIKRKE